MVGKLDAVVILALLAFAVYLLRWFERVSKRKS